MDLHPTSDHQEIIDGAAEYLARELPADRAPKQQNTSLSAREWGGLADMGWLAMGLPEDAGGLGLSVVEEALVLREFGRNLVPPQALATMLAAHLAHALGDDQLTSELGSGKRRVALAIPSSPGGDGPWTGAYRLVDTDQADLAICWSQAGAWLPPLEAFSGRAPAPPVDATLKIETADGLDLGQARWLPAGDNAFTARARVLTAAVLTGGAEGVRDVAAEYAKVRQQFGRPIGSFQAIAHPIAKMAVRAESSLACLFYAAVCCRDDRPERDFYSASARSVAHAAAYENAAAAMQVHGGYGQTYEYLPHFYVKRAMIYGLAGDGVDADEQAVLAASSLF